MPFADRIPCQKGFVTPCEFFSANCMPLLAEFSIEKALLPHTISFFTNYMPSLASFFIKKKLCYRIWALSYQINALHWPRSLSGNLCHTNISSLITFNYMPLTNPILSQKGFVTPYETFSANYMPISWAKSPSKKRCYPIWARFCWHAFYCYSFVLMQPFTGPILYQKTFVTRI